MSERVYICPMHPQVRQKKSGRCPKCGMELELEGKASDHTEDMGAVENSYTPLIVIVALIVVVSTTLSLRDFLAGDFSIFAFIMYFMTGFFIVFAGFKLMDLRGFAQGYFTYDLLAKRWFTYGYIYPFIELFFGLSMILGFFPRTILWIELIVMTFSGIGVAIKLARHERFQCACLGTFLKVPLTKVTLVEDFGMAALAALLLIFGQA